MANLRQAFMTTAWRGFEGMVLGAMMVSVPSLTVTGILFGFDLALTAMYGTPLMLADELVVSGAALSLVFVACLLVGGIAGLAARLPPKGMGMLRAIAVVAGCTVLAIVLAIVMMGLGWHAKGPPFMMMTLGAVVGGVIVLLFGFDSRNRSEADDGSGKVGTDNPKPSVGKHANGNPGTC